MRPPLPRPPSTTSTAGAHEAPKMPASDRRRPSFIPIPRLSHTPTPPPLRPSSSSSIPPLISRHLSPCPRWSAFAETALRDPAFAPLLRSAAVFDAVAASTAAVALDRPALSALLSLWHPGSHAFRLPAGPATFSLEDALLLAGLAPSGAPLDRALTPEEDDLRIRLVVEKEKIKEIHPCARDAGHVSAEVWLEWFHTSIRPGEDDELRRLGFLAYWLAFFVTPRLQRAGGELPDCAFALAARLSLGERVALGPAVVANLYAEMDRIVSSGESGRVNVWAPLWLLQVWMWERFQALRPPDLKAPQAPLSNVRVLHWSKRKRTTTPSESLRVLQDEACFDWRPYAQNSLNWTQPKWFDKHTIFVSSRSNDKPDWLEDYIAVVRQEVMTGWYGDGTSTSAMYNPHIVARQFGYDQDVPLPTAVHGSESKAIHVWLPSVGRYGAATKNFVAWWDGRHIEANQNGNSATACQENMASSPPRNADDTSLSERTVDKFRGDTNNGANGKCIRGEQLGNVPEENKRKVIVQALSAGSNASAVRRKKDKTNGLAKFPEGGDTSKKNNKVFCSQFCDYMPSILSNNKNDSLQFEDQGYSELQKYPNSTSYKHEKSAQLNSDDECIVLNLPDTKHEVIIIDDDVEQSIVDSEHHDQQLALELEEFVRAGLLSQWGESSDEDEEGGRKRKTLKKITDDPYAEAAIREYPLFFELIPQKPHYRGLASNADALGDLTYSGLWFLLVGLAKEVLKTSYDTDASEIAYLMKKAQKLEQLGFNVKHLVARLKEPPTQSTSLHDSWTRREDARKVAQQSKGVKSFPSHLSKLRQSILMESQLDGY